MGQWNQVGEWNQHFNQPLLLHLFQPIHVNFHHFAIQIFISLNFYRNSALAEGIVCIALCCLIFPANLLAIYKFYQKGINRIFFTLITAFCITNMSYASVGFVNGVATFRDHPFELVGCGISYCGGSICLNITMAIQTLISYERRKVITSVTIATFSSRVYILLSLLIAGLIGFWILMYSVLVDLKYVPIHLEPNSTKVANVCIAPSRIFPGFLELVFAVCQLVIPGTIIIRNYL